MPILIAGICGTGILSTMDSTNMHEIEDRLEVPVNVDLVAFAYSALAFAALGLLVGAIVKPMWIAVMFPGFLMSVAFTGASFFSWKALSPTSIFQILVLVNMGSFGGFPCWLLGIAFSSTG